VSNYIALDYWELAAASIFVLFNAALSVIFGLRIHRSFLFAAIRMVVQLSLVGLVLTTLFSIVSPLWTGLAALGMVLFAGYEAAQRQERRLADWWSYGLGTGCMMMASLTVTVFALVTVLRPNPWYDPRYAIPLLGMILGNCMTGVGLGLDTLTTSLMRRRAGVEAQLMLGASRWAATAPVTREALRSALMPVINSMAATGVVSLPGMMTGQILGGVPPAEAVKYQILVMFLIAGGTGLGAVTAVLGGVYRLTDGRHRLRLDRLTAARAAYFWRIRRCGRTGARWRSAASASRRSRAPPTFHWPRMR
jgi:putative ABC transport system permease protein